MLMALRLAPRCEPLSFAGELDAVIPELERVHFAVDGFQPVEPVSDRIGAVDFVRFGQDDCECV